MAELFQKMYHSSGARLAEQMLGDKLGSRLHDPARFLIYYDPSIPTTVVYKRSKNGLEKINI